MLTDPLSVTYDGVVKSLARVGVGPIDSSYATSDGEFEISISNSPGVNPKGTAGRRIEVILTRFPPDSTDPAFSQARFPSNSVGLVYWIDSSRSFTTADVPLLRAALLALVDTTLQGRLISNEK